MAIVVKTLAGSWKAVIRKTGWPTTAKTFRTKRDAQDWTRRTEDEMVRGVYIQCSASERMTLEAALKRYLADVTPTKKCSGQKHLTTTVGSAPNRSLYNQLCEDGVLVESDGTRVFNEDQSFSSP